MTNVASFCSAYTPIRWSRHDTRPTQEQIVALNRTWAELCR